MKIILHNGSQIYPVPSLINANVRDGINGEFTLSFTLYGNESFLVEDSTIIEYDGQFFQVAGWNRYEAGKLPACDVSCEHISYSLNQRVDHRIEYSGNIAGILNIIFSGTPFSVGKIESEYTFDEISVHGNTYKRNVLYNTAAVSGCEVEYNGYVINLVKHRGSVEYINLLDTDNVIDVRKRKNIVSDVVYYDITLGRKTILKAGDNVKIVYAPLRINDETRIIGIDYNPYNPFEVSIDVGDYIPDILDSFEKIEKEASEAADKVNGFDDRLNEAEERLQDTVTKSGVSASIDTYINSASGTASIVAACGGIFVTEDEIAGFRNETQVRSIISSEINQTGGSIKLFVEGKNYLTQTAADGAYLKSTELNAGISAYVNTQTGAAQITSAVSGTYQTKDAMTGYATTAYVSNSITQSVSPVESKIALVVGAGKLVGSTGSVDASIVVTAVNNSGSTIKINADKIQMTGTTTFLKASDIGSGGTTTIDGGRITTGTISASRIDVGSLYIGSIYNPSNQRVVWSDSSMLYIGGISTIYMSYIDIKATSTISLKGSSYGITVNTGGRTIVPNQSGWYLGNSAYEFDRIYTRNIYAGYVYVDNVLLNLSNLLKDTDIKRLYYSTSYYVEYNSSQQLISNYSYASLGSSSYKWSTGYITTLESTNIKADSILPLTTYLSTYLGNSSYYWTHAYIGSTQAVIGNSVSSNVGFFGSTGAKKQTISKLAATATQTNIIDKVNAMLTAFNAHGFFTSS